jgi:hypothetical protein
VTDLQLYLSIGVPSLLMTINLAVMLFSLNTLNGRVTRIENRIDDLVGAINELDKRLTRVEVKIGIQP